MESKRNGAINLLLLLLLGISTFATARYANSLAGQVAVAFLILGVLAALVSWFQMRLEERERLEKLEFDELARAGGSATLFNTGDSETFPAQRSREQFEKVFVPAFSVAMLILQGLGAWWSWNWLRAQATAPQHTFIAVSLLGIFALVLFMIGKYSANLARLQRERLLRPSAGYLLLGAYVLTAAVVGLVASEAGFLKGDRYIAMGLCVLLAVLAIENLLTLLLEIYRPRVKGKIDRVLYESRLVGLLGQPEGLFTTLAHALDYQFGFKVSDTGFYRFLEKYLPRLIVAQFAIFLFSTCFVFIDAGEEALLERFGRPVASGKVLQPGFHLKWPWPIDRVYRERTQEIRRFAIGFVHDENQGEGDEHQGPLLWTVQHYKEEFNLLVASREALETNALAGRRSPPVNLLSVSIPVQYQITNLLAWTYTHRNPGNLLERIGTREAVRYLVSADFQELMSTARFGAAEELRRRIQEEANRQNLGVKILFLGLQDIHPPVQVAEAYESVSGALQKRQANLLAAAAHKAQTNALAGAEALRLKRMAEAERQRIAAGAKAEAGRFTNQISAYAAAPAVYAMRSYLDVIGRVGANTRKIILATTNAQDIFMLNLEEKFSGGLLNAPLPSTSK